MAKSFRPLKLPKTEAELKELLEKLKDKEARLEADLAIKEFPEVEPAITKIVLLMADAKKARHILNTNLSLLQPDDKKAVALHESLAALKQKREALGADPDPKIEKQRVHIESRIEVLEEMIGDADPPNVVTLDIAAAGAKQRLTDAYHEERENLEASGVDLPRLIPTINDFIVG